MDDMREHIASIVEAAGAILEDIRIPEKAGTIRVICDTEKGIDSLELVRITKMILNDAEYDARCSERYDLEVSSPGIGSRLTLPRHFRKNIDRDIDLYHKEENEKNPLRARILGVEQDFLHLEIRKSRKEVQNISFPLDKIQYALVKVKW